jgi:hypothetical protein
LRMDTPQKKKPGTVHPKLPFWWGGVGVKS